MKIAPSNITCVSRPPELAKFGLLMGLVVKLPSNVLWL